MNDKQEKKLIIEDDQMPPLEHAGTPGILDQIHQESITPSEVFCASLVQAIEQETARVAKVREDNILKKYILDIQEVAADCDFEFHVELTRFNRLQLIQILEALRNLHREQRKI